MNHDIQATAALIEDLSRTVIGDTRFDKTSRLLYSTDASNYRVVPCGVFLPASIDDVCGAVAVAAQHQMPLVPRGGGTSVSGQAIGSGLIVDNSRHLRGILELNTEERWVRVETGVNLEFLNQQLAAHGLAIGPDPSSAQGNSVGGMVANNTSGTHSILYGLTLDHVREVDVVLPDGNRATFGPTSAEMVAFKAQQNGLEARLYREIPALVERYRTQIETRTPKPWRNVAGFNLHRLLRDKDQGFDFSLAPLIVGSEGALANIVSVKMDLVALPRHRRIAVLHFDDLLEAMRTVPAILEADVAGVELQDRLQIETIRAHSVFGPLQEGYVQGNPDATLTVEFYGDTETEVAHKAGEMQKNLQNAGFSGAITQCTTQAQMGTVMATRRALFGLSQSIRGDAKPLNIADDAAVPVERLADYVGPVLQNCKALGIRAGFSAHASAGCLHISPLLNLKDERDLNTMKEFSKMVVQAAIDVGGTTSGEHGEGLAKSYYNEQLFGPDLHKAFRETKALFDERNLMNPGKIIDGPEPWRPDILRYNPAYRRVHEPRDTVLNFDADGGFAGLVEMCNGQGVCRRTVDMGTMCPSFRATRDEAAATRGRANILRAAISGQLDDQGLTSKEVHSVMDLCFECKACKTECATRVDMAKLKYEFLNLYQKKHGVPLRSRLFANVAVLNKAGRVAPWAANWAYRNTAVRFVLDKALGVDKRRVLPRIAGQSFGYWFMAHQPHPNAGKNGEVVLWDDTYLRDNEPEIGIAAVQVLEACGYKVRLLAERKCCGRPMISKGLLEQARAHAAHNVALLAPYVAAGTKVVGLEPSCIVSFRDEYPDLLRGAQAEAAREVAESCLFIEEFLTQEGCPPPPLQRDKGREILLHGHCHQKATIGTGPIRKMLELIPGAQVREIRSGCCGMAGAFGYEKEHYEVSMACGEERLFPTVRAAGSDTVIAAAGTSCRHQIGSGTGRKAYHPITILADALEA